MEGVWVLRTERAGAARASTGLATYGHSPWNKPCLFKGKNKTTHLSPWRVNASSRVGAPHGPRRLLTPACLVRPAASPHPVSWHSRPSVPVSDSKSPTLSQGKRAQAVLGLSRKMVSYTSTLYSFPPQTSSFCSCQGFGGEVGFWGGKGKTGQMKQPRDLRSKVGTGVCIPCKPALSKLQRTCGSPGGLLRCQLRCRTVRVGREGLRF